VRRLGQYFLDNPLHAMAAALFFTVLPLVSIPVGFLAAILVGFVTLHRGYKLGLVVLLGVAIPAFAVAIWKQAFVIDFVLIRCLLVWLLASILCTTVSWRLVLEVMTIVGLLAVLGFHLFLEDTVAWWSGILNHYAAFLNSIVSGQLSEDRMQELVTQAAPIASGLFSALLLSGAFAQLLLARWWQATLFRPGGLAKEFVEIRAGTILAVVLTVTLIVAVMGVDFAIDALPVVILPFAIAGLSLIHKWMRFNKKAVYLVVAVYIGLIFLPILFMSVLALAGYVDSWYNLRKRFFVNHLPTKGG